MEAAPAAPKGVVDANAALNVAFVGADCGDEDVNDEAVAELRESIVLRGIALPTKASSHQQHQHQLHWLIAVVDDL